MTFSTGVVKFVCFCSFFFFKFQILVAQCHTSSDVTSKILYSHSDVGACSPISGRTPFNFNVKGMLQASGSLGSWCVCVGGGGARTALCV